MESEEVSGLFTTVIIRDSSPGKWLFLPLPFLDGSASIEQTLPIFLNGTESFYPIPYLVGALQRPKGESFTYSYEFQLKLNLSTFSKNTNINYDLIGIIGYFNFHFVYFRLIDEEKWVMINDETSYEIKAELIPCLKGGDSFNPLWQEINQKWVARVLLYQMTKD